MLARLGQLCEIQIGYQVKGRVVSRPGDTHLLVQSADLAGERGIDWAHLASFTPGRRRVDHLLLRDGDVLFLAKGPRRQTATVRDPRPGTLASSTFYRLRVRDDAVLDPDYLVWYLNAAGREAVNALEVQGTTMAFVPKEAFSELEIPLPDTATQQRLSVLDALLRRERRLTLDLLDQRARLARAVAEKALTRKEDKP